MKATTRPAPDARRSATLGPFARALAVTLTAPVAPLRLNGTWTATSGRGGTFNIGRE